MQFRGSLLDELLNLSWNKKIRNYNLYVYCWSISSLHFACLEKYNDVGRDIIKHLSYCWNFFIVVFFGPWLYAKANNFNLIFIFKLKVFMIKINWKYKWIECLVIILKILLMSLCIGSLRVLINFLLYFWIIYAFMIGEEFEWIRLIHWKIIFT